MALPKKKLFSDYNRYVTDEDFTTSAEAQDYFANMDELMEAVIDSGYWQPETKYSKGDVVVSPAMPSGAEAICVAENGGLSSSVEPSWGEVGGANVSDGTCFWQLRYKNAGTYFAAVGGSTDRDSSLPTYGLENDVALKQETIAMHRTDEQGNKVLQLPITDFKNVEGLLDFVHPVGSLYWSKNPTDPATLFGGTWTRVKDKFILAAGDSYEQGATGGAATVTLTTDQMPSHTHTGSASSKGISDHIHATGYNSGNNGGTFIATKATGTYVGTVSLDSKASYSRKWNGSGGDNALTSIGTSSGSYSANMATSRSLAASSGTTGSHSHTVTIANAGGGKAHNNMPPYVTYYCWERTA